MVKLTSQEPVVYVNGLPNTLRDPERCFESDFVPGN